MILLRDYNEKTKLDRVWYNSSNIVYSECQDNDNHFKDLKIVFKNGGTYMYHKVDVNDYVMFVHGGLDGSNGKALNKYIKPKSEFEKLDSTDISLLNEELQRLQKEREDKGKSEENTKKEE